MMLRLLYSCLLRLHPEGFRKRFAQEMLSIFDHVEKGPAAVKLVADALLSLVRQWTLRSEYWERASERVPWSADGAPVFYTLESFKPRRGALFAGGILTLTLFCAGYLDLKFDWSDSAFILFKGLEFTASPKVDAPSSLGRAVAPAKIPEDALQIYPGAYVTDPPNEFTILIAAEDGELAIEIPREPKSRLVPAHGTRFVFSGPHDGNGNWIEFVKHEDGAADELRIYRNGRHFTARRKP
jgi:hypothetical protein